MITNLFFNNVKKQIILVTVLCITGIFVFYKFSNATVLTEGFDSYNNGTLAGQGSWVDVWQTERWTVTDSVYQAGTKSATPWNVGETEKSFVAQSTGTQDFYIRVGAGNTNCGVNIGNNSANHVAYTVFQYGHIYFANINIQETYSVDTWYHFVVEWDLPNNHLRIKIDSGEWSDWIDTGAYETFGFIDLYYGGNGTCYVDTFYDSNVPTEDDIDFTAPTGTYTTALDIPLDSMITIASHCWDGIEVEFDHSIYGTSLSAELNTTHLSTTIPFYFSYGPGFSSCENWSSWINHNFTSQFDLNAWDFIKYRARFIRNEYGIITSKSEWYYDPDTSLDWFFTLPIGAEEIQIVSSSETAQLTEDMCDKMGLIGEPICRVLLWLFLPPNSLLNDFKQLPDKFSYKVPFYYYFETQKAIQESLSSISNDSPDNLLTLNLSTPDAEIGSVSFIGWAGYTQLQTWANKLLKWSAWITFVMFIIFIIPLFL